MGTRLHREFMERMWIHRTLCDVLDEMRQCHKTRNYSALRGLVEEAQGMGNRMEAAIDGFKDYEKAMKELPELRNEYNDLVEKIRDAKGDVGK